MKKLILAIAIFLGASPLWAELMTYQGRLKESGIPVTGNRSFTFEFCDQETGGPGCLAAPGTPAPFAVANGLFKSTITIPSGVDLAAGPWYLRVTVGASVLTPLERLTAVPYSVFASSAAYTAGAVRKTGDTMTGQLTLEGSTLTVTGSEFSVGGSTFVVKAGNVGIGGAAPLYRLAVSSGAGEAGTILAVSTGTSELFWVAGDGAHATKFYGDGSGLSGVTGAIDDTKVLATGDTMTGPLHILSDDLANDTSDLITTGIVISTGGAIQTTGLGHGTAVGNARGNGAVDLQTYRALATQVASGNYSVLSGGFLNKAVGAYSAVGGGYTNSAEATYAAVGGGIGNTASGQQSAVAGGSNNTASAQYAAVGGGYNNTATLNSAVVAGGSGNHATGTAASITGGANNTASGNWSAIGGGGYNLASGNSAVVPGGAYNGALGDYSLAAGRISSSTASGAFTWADSEGVMVQNAVADRTVFKSRGGFLVTGSTNTSMTGALDRGVFITGSGLVGVSTGSPQAPLDVVSSGTAANIYAQIWRDSNGLAVSSVNSQGVFYGDGSGLSNLPVPAGALQKAGDTMTGTLNMNGNLLASVSTINILNGIVAIVPAGTAGSNANYGVSIGSNAHNNYSSGVGLGRDAYNNYNYGVGVGAATNNNYNYGVGVGSNAAGNYNSGVGLGRDSYGNYDHGTGVGAGANDNSVYGTGAGYEARLNFNYGVGLGAFASGNDDHAVGVGAYSKNNGGYGAAVGAYSYASSSAAALGAQAMANAELSLALGYGTVNNSTGTASFGNYAVNAPSYWIGGSTVVRLGSGNGTFAAGPAAGGQDTGSYNLFVGSAAGYGHGNGNNNVMLGYSAGYQNTTGEGNVFIGAAAANTNSSGNQNIVIGSGQLTSAQGSSSELNIGGLIFGQLDVKTVGISTRVPQAALDIVSTGTAANVYAQIWRGGDGVARASVTATGVFYGDGSGLTGVTAAGAVQKLGDTMQGTLDMGGNYLAGVSTITMQNGSIAIVPPGTAGSNNNYGISIGSNSYNNYNFGVGVGNNAFGNSSGGVGVGVSASGNKDAGVGVGYAAANNDDNAVGVGSYAKDNAPYSAAVGAYSHNNKTYGAALGAYSYASSSATALGAHAKANAELSLALGNGTVNNSTGTASFGSYAVRTSSAISAAYYQVNGSTVLALSGVSSFSAGVGAAPANTGSYGTYVGSFAGGSNAAGGYNSFLGFNSGNANTAGSYNSFAGAYSGNANITGNSNAAFGYRAGANNQTGSANAQFGADAGYGVVSNSYSSATLMGYRAGYGLTTGDANIFIGYRAGYSVTTGTGNIVIGFEKDVYVPTDNNVLNIGGVLFGSLDEKTIGINSFLPPTPVKPEAALDVISTGTASNVYAQIWRDSNGVAVSSVSAQGVFYGNGSGLTGITASDATKLPLAGGSLTGQLTTVSTITVQGSAFSVGASTFVVSAGRVGINWTTPEAALQVSGGAKFLLDAGTSYILTAGSVAQPDMFFVSSGGIVGAGDFTGMFIDTYAVVNVAPVLKPGADGAVGLTVLAHTDIAGVVNANGPDHVLAGGNFEAAVWGDDTVTLLAALRTKLRRESAGAGLVSKAYGLLVDDIGIESAAGVITDTYGIYIGDQSSAFGGTQTNVPYAIYSQDPAAKVFFAGNLGLANEQPAARLDLSASASNPDTMAQIWRDLEGDIVSSMSATGVMTASRFVGDGGGLTGLSGVQKTGDTMTGALTISGSSLTIRPAVSDAYSLYISSADGSTPAFTVRPGGQLYAAGRVGIGSAAPTEALDISGRVFISTRAGDNEVTDGLMSTGTGGMEFFSGGAKYMKVANGGTFIGIGPNANVDSTTNSPRLQVKGSMSVGSAYNSSKPPADGLVVQTRLGVGTPAPDAALSVVQSDVGVSSYTVHIGTSSSAYHLVVTTNGWVGLNTRQPQAPLHLTAATKDEGIVVEHNSNTSEGSYFALLKARGTASAQNLVLNGDNLGVLAFGGYNGPSSDPFPMAAAIMARVDGEPTAFPTMDMPGRLEFMTAADGTTDMVARMVIRNDGSVGISTGIPQAMLDIRSTATVAQVWRDSGGVVRASMTAAGLFYANIPGLADKVSRTGDTMVGPLTISAPLTVAVADLEADGFDLTTTGIKISTSGALQTQGFGEGTANPEDSRGAGAVDLQTARSLGNQVAGGNFSVIAGGRQNRAFAAGSVISGGENNYAGGTYSFLGGGQNNSAPGNYSAIAGGESNSTDWGQHSFVGGGSHNTVNGEHSVASGGSYNLVTGSSSVVGGGAYNVVRSTFAVIAGGRGNTANGLHSFLGAGYLNAANGEKSVLGGGAFNTTDAQYGVITGGYENKMQSGATSAFIGGGRLNTVTTFGLYSAVVGGSSNTVAGDGSFIGGGAPSGAGLPGNRIYASFSSIVGGSSNTITSGAHWGFIGGGGNNQVSGESGAVVGGGNNLASGLYSSIGGGYSNKATSDAAFVGGGGNNSASGFYSAVPGGYQNTAKGSYSFAAGYKSSSTLAGTFTWADSLGTEVLNDVANQVMFKAAGGFWVSTGTVYTDPALYVSNTNRVGIGTSTPGFKLHVRELNTGAIAGLTSSANIFDAGVYGWSDNVASAIKGVASSGYAGRFEGKVLVTDDGVNPVNPAKLQVKGDLGLGNGLQDGNTPIVIWLTASTPFTEGDVVIASGNYQFGTTVVATTSTVMGVALGTGIANDIGKIAVAGVVTANCTNGFAGNHAVTSSVAGRVQGQALPNSGTSVGLFLTNCGNPVTNKAVLLLK